MQLERIVSESTPRMSTPRMQAEVGKNSNSLCDLRYSQIYSIIFIEMPPSFMGCVSSEEDAKPTSCLDVDLPCVDLHSPLGYQSDDSVGLATTSRSSSMSRASLDSSHSSLHPVTVEQTHSQVLHNIQHYQQRFNW